MESRKNLIVTAFLLLFIFVIILFFASFVNAASCWTYTSEPGGCNATNGCKWKNDSWSSSGWCEDLNCWSLYSQDECTTTVVPGKNCTWSSGSATYSCEEISCWSFTGTNSSTCEINSQNKSCSWSNTCYNSGGSGGNVDCWSITSQATCSNTTGCSWGQCWEKSCSEQITEGACNAGLDWNGNNCSWSSISSTCGERSCYNGALYSNKTACNAAIGINCEWKWGSCQEKGCWSFDFTNETACENNTIGETCIYEGGYCNSDNCWSATSNSSCSSKSNCQWSSWTGSSWCEEINCWSWDSSRGGNQTQCEENTNGLNCIWTGNPAGNDTSGWCYVDNSASTCSNITTERSCYDTYYCWWQANNWNDVSVGGNCTEPTWGSGEYQNISGNIQNDWNPGCYIFNLNSSKCNNVLGCSHTNGECQQAVNANGTAIGSIGLNCYQINESTLCNDIASLSTCCIWQNGTCTQNLYSNSCVSQLDQTPNGEEACEDAKTSSDCELIAGDPWYMPCAWSNSSNSCLFKAVAVFGNTSHSIVKIENQRNCEAAGGKWITENYCEGSVAVPTGRCEYKFDDEDNCDKACFACETFDRNGNRVNTTNAKSACLGSNLGFCEYINNTNAPNGIGYCTAKDQWKKGIAGDCNSACGDCNYLGNSNSNSTRDSSNNCLTPSCYCSESDANTAGGGCKWITDNSTDTGGYCLKKNENTCEDACDRCNTIDKCANDGRSALNSSGSCKWQGGDDDGACVANVAGDVEVCWDGVDNNGDGLIDCADSSCYSDTWCGYVTGDCFGWTNNNTCISKGCEWVNDTWNPSGWCDFKGSQCWKNDNDEVSCTGIVYVNETLDITNARLAGNYINESYTFVLQNLGAGWVLNSVSITNDTGTSFSGNFTVDYNNSLINFTNTTFMISGGGIPNITNVSYQYYSDGIRENCEWNAGSGSGWCEQDWSVQEECFNGRSEVACFSINTTDGLNCTWSNDTWCNGAGSGSTWCQGNAGWCDHSLFAHKDCWQYSSNSTCSDTVGCNWRINEYSSSYCDLNWSGQCWNQFDSTSCTASNCTWRTSGSSSWCDHRLAECYEQTTETACTTLNTGVDCVWQSWGSGGGSCQPKCFTQNSENFCSGVAGCVWVEESGWCEEQQSQSCYNATNNNNQINCDATSGCKWNNPGWCDPKDGGFSGGAIGGGGGSGGASGAECYKYDGNQTLCTNSSLINITCGWFPEPAPRCEVDWSTECWQYSTSGDCSSNSCWWFNDTAITGSEGGWCMNIFDQCWSNNSLRNDSVGCNANANCNYTTWGSCEPTCFSASTEASCTGSCKWVTGWCNPGGMNELFNGMESGAPVPIGFDPCGSNGVNQTSVDICGFGMKDSGDAFVFGVNVFDFSNSSVCNKEKISSNVFEAFGGGTGSSNEKIGNGNETVKFIVYLDTDGSTTGSCSLTHNNSASGYEFRLRYNSEWNASKQKAVETFTASKCENSKWKASDIKLTTWKKLMCSEIGGPMIGIEKTDLTRFPSLYDSSTDMRIYVLTIGDTGNVSSPSDTAGPGYSTPGTIDFEISGCFEYGADTAKFEDILSKGFVQYEDCFDGIDNNNNGLTDCNDWDCQFSSKCDNSGVNAENYVDTKTPQVTGVRIEEYPDSMLVMYDTNKPSNGTLQFFGNDSRCLKLNDTIKDIGIRSNSIREFKLWHKAEVYNNSANSLDFALDNDTTYYYKLKVCDNANKCAVSKCTSFTTSPQSKCGFCNFVTRLKTSSDWIVSYDVDQDGTFEHVQGQVCGTNAGMKSNYTMGRAVDIKLEKSDGSTYFLFLNATLTKTGLNDKVRTISSSGDIISASEYVGLTSSSRDKIINNLHPERCRIKVPFTDTCTSLFHCDDNGENCVDRSSSATLVDASACLWEVPFCEFSTYRTTDPNADSGGSSGSSSSGGGGGGSGGLPSITTTPTEDSSEVESSDSGEIEDKEKVDGEKSDDKDVEVKRDEKISLGFIWIVVGVVAALVIAAVAYFGKRSIKKRRGY